MLLGRFGRAEKCLASPAAGRYEGEVGRSRTSWQWPQPISGTSTGTAVSRQEAPTSTRRPIPSNPDFARASKTKLGQALAIEMRGTRHLAQRSGAQEPPLGVSSMSRHS